MRWELRARRRSTSSSAHWCRPPTGLMAYKYIVKNVCHNLGYTATFMPKPLFGDNGSGMHCHQSLWKDDTPLFFDAKGYALLSDTARWYIGGLISHAPALLGLCAPTTNSYRRLVPGFEAPVNLMYSAAEPLRDLPDPDLFDNPKARRVEFRAPDPTANPYLAFSAMLMAGLDGIKRKIEPPQPIDEDLYELHDERKSTIKMVPGSLAEALDALENDHDFLLEGDVFTPDVIDTWISMKRTKESRRCPAAASVRVFPVLRCVRADATHARSVARGTRITGRGTSRCTRDDRSLRAGHARPSIRFPPMPTPLRSDAITVGVQRAPNRAMLRAVGFGDGDFGSRSSGSPTATVRSRRATPASTCSRTGPRRRCAPPAPCRRPSARSP